MCVPLLHYSHLQLANRVREGQTTTDPNHPANEPHQLKIEVPANRYDLLCIEGIARALKLYINPELGSPNYTLKPAPLVRLLLLLFLLGAF